MDWQLFLILLLVAPFVLFPAVLVWYLNFGGIYSAVKQKKFIISETVSRTIKTVLALVPPVAIYIFGIWFSLGKFGWQVALAVGIVLPVILLVPVLVWATIVSGVYTVARESLLRRRAAVPQRKIVRLAEEPVSKT